MNMCIYLCTFECIKRVNEFDVQLAASLVKVRAVCRDSNSISENYIHVMRVRVCLMCTSALLLLFETMNAIGLLD